MSNEQGIRDEIAQALFDVALENNWFDVLVAEDIAAAVMPSIRRIQAEALREAADSIERRRNEPGLVKLDVQYAGYYTGIRSGMESSVKALRAEADRIEQNSEGNVI